MENTTPLWGPGCPWYDMHEKFGPPNVKWCEERLCSWFNEPANAWSNLGYITVAVWILWYARRNKMPLGKLYGLAVLSVGLTSGWYHMSNNYLTQIFDFIGMYFMVYLLVVLNLLRLKWIESKTVVPLFLGLVVGSTALIPVADKIGVPYQFIVAGVVVVIAVTELLNQRRDRKNAQEWKVWPFWASLASFCIAVSFSIADVKRILCDPQNHFIQGHALWHIGGAIGLTFSFLYYRQFLQKNVVS